MKDGDIGEHWGKALRENKFLVHLDLSFNKIAEVDTKTIMEEIVFNNALVGFHYLGNQDSGKRDEKVGKVDSLGFVRMEGNMKQSLTKQHMLMGLPSGYPHQAVKSKMLPRLKNAIGMTLNKDFSLTSLNQPN